MNQIKTGKFIAELRHGKGLTQESLGERIGVSNKTISRWENGNYMPDIEMLQVLSQFFDVTINELVAGQRLMDEDFREKADENIVLLSQDNPFSRKERETYFKSKWRKDHKALLILLGLLVVLAFAIPILIHKPWFSCTAPLVATILYGYQNNKMMTYVEHQIYD